MGLRRLAHGLVVVSCVLHLAVRVGLGLSGIGIARAELAVADTLHQSCPEGSRSLLVAGSDPGVGFYGGSVAAYRYPRYFVGNHVLSMAPNDHKLIRTGPRELRLEIVGARRTTLFEELYRSPASPLRVGDRLEAGEFEVHVLETGPGGFEKVRLVFRQPLEDKQYCFVHWQGGAVRRLALPALGEAREVPHEPGPMGL